MKYSLKIISKLYNEARRIGWLWTIGHRILKILKVEEFKVRVRNLDQPVYIRIANSDIYEFKQSLGSWQEEFDLGYTPDLIIDAGANVGYTSLRFLQKYPKSKIIALEPEPSNIKQFIKNCSKYKNITLEQAAIWPTSRMLSFISLDVASNSFQVKEEPKGEIRGISFLDLIDKYKIDKIDLLKIDIEGSEKFLLEDSNVNGWLDKVGTMLIESHEHKIPGCHEIIKKVTSNNFEYLGQINEYEFYQNNKYLK